MSMASFDTPGLPDRPGRHTCGFREHMERDPTADRHAASIVVVIHTLSRNHGHCRTGIHLEIHDRRTVRMRAPYVDRRHHGLARSGPPNRGRINLIYAVSKTSSQRAVKMMSPISGLLTQVGVSSVISFDNSGRLVEWHVDLSKSFESIAFNLAPRFHHAIVLLLPAFALPWFKSIGSIFDTMSSNGVEELLIEDLAVR